MSRPAVVKDGSVGVDGEGRGRVDGQGGGAHSAGDVGLCQHRPLRKLSRDCLLDLKENRSI